MSNRSEGIVGLAGTFLAGYMSWTRWHSIFWLVIHGICGWIYVIYSLIKYGVPKF
jgi:hypothetical protein